MVATESERRHVAQLIMEIMKALLSYLVVIIAFLVVYIAISAVIRITTQAKEERACGPSDSNPLCARGPGPAPAGIQGPPGPMGPRGERGPAGQSCGCDRVPPAVLGMLAEVDAKQLDGPDTRWIVEYATKSGGTMRLQWQEAKDEL